MKYEQYLCLGMCLHKDVAEEHKKAKVQSSKMERDLHKHASMENNVVKILTLGAPETGKSTIVKQIKIIHNHGFSKQELISFKPAVLDNLLTSMKTVLQGMGTLRINLANKQNKSKSCSFSFVLFPSSSFFENMSRIIAPNYIPTDADVLRVRVRTCGIIETQFQVDKTMFRLYDVRGQQSERRKWLSCFEGIQAVVFVVALNSYDMTLLEDPSVNRLQESLELFSSICIHTVFQQTTMILFMNKTDLFREKILKSGRHLRLYHSSYKGADGDVDAAAHNITAMFSACNSNPDRPVYHHFTTAIDATSVRVAFHVVVDQIMRGNLEAVQLV
ncbi:guanine nucleotide-binding protein G(o) subunit alpha-like [Neolamprologus brichardi]|uniref:guanine nucleotide-binding protein G(o) subunit alpha-like n=1 Tax=Neolamprologus brichardi TaxID=32507 RepID=UPI001643DEC6|nr:guanine nucleotide-binding protein G(o) subunit alpha-like [Neolamprologus brichardi]